MHHRLLHVSFAAAVALALPAPAAELLFPAPIHLTRQIHDSIGNSTTVVEQYCYANRIVTVRGPVTTIADYGKGELTEIHREERTYSITRFDDVAKALRAGTPAAAGKTPWKIRSAGLSQLRTSRASESIEAELEDGPVTRRTRVAVDRTVTLSRDALDVLIGAAYPNSGKPEDQVIVGAARAARGAGVAADGRGGEDAFALPVEQHNTFIIEGHRAETRDVVTRVGSELVPPGLVAIPPDAKLVESRLVQRMQAIEQLDSAGRTAPLPQQ